MQFRLSAKTLAIAATLAVGVQSTSNAALITVKEVSGTGSYTDSGRLPLLIDGIVPAEGSVWTGATNVYWNGLTPTFTLEFNSVYTLDDLLIQVDNNDNYRIDYSLNGSDWTTLYTIPNTMGTVNYGMDTFTQTDINFTPVNARYLRVQATGGDDKYAISEIQAFGTPVPEPATLTLLGAGVLFGQVLRKRRELVTCE